MKKNMGMADKIIRIILAAIIAGLYLGHFISGIIAVVLLALATIFIVTSFISFCPLYVPFGISSCKKNN
jgi:hypothetical protein